MMTVAAQDKEAAIKELKTLLGENLSTARAVREHHGKDESWHPPLPPDAVCYPHATHEVSEIKAQAMEVGEIAREQGGGEFLWTTDKADRERVWQARHDSFYAALALRPGSKGLSTDVCVPISRLAECIGETKKDLEASYLIAPLVGHVGDGNFHLTFLTDPNDPAEIREAERLHERLVLRALALDGTGTGEHGVGLGKRRFLVAEHGNALIAMHAIKQALDPGNIMNPGKIL